MTPAPPQPDILMVGYFPPEGAVAELFFTISAALAERVAVATLAPDHLEAVPGSIADHRFPYSSRRPDRAVSGRGWTAHRAAAAASPRVAMFFTQHPLNVVAAACLRRSRLALWWHEPVGRGQAGVQRRVVYGTHDRLIVPRCDTIVVASESVRISVPDRYRRRCVVVPFPGPIGFEDASVRFQASRTDLVFFGKLETYKGLDTLADALVLLERRGLTPTLRVVGPGRLDAASPRMAAFCESRPGRVDRVDEYAPAADIASALHAGDVCVLPYLSAAGSSAIAVAGMQRSALIASSAGSFGDYLIDHLNARLHPPGDEERLAAVIEELLLDSDQRRRLGEALYDLQAERFGSAVAAEALIAALQ
jgi:glycosyltransferase involved in cell wall biosynthesis